MTVYGSSNVGVATTAPEFKFYEFEIPFDEGNNDPFVYNEDGTLDLFLTGKIVVDGNGRFKSNVNIPNGVLTVQEVDILAAIQELQNRLGIIQSDISTLFNSLSS